MTYKIIDTVAIERASATRSISIISSKRPLDRLVGGVMAYHFRNKSGSLAMLTAIRLASSFVSSLAADRRPGLRAVTSDRCV
jgi:hypothetical protein